MNRVYVRHDLIRVTGISYVNIWFVSWGGRLVLGPLRLPKTRNGLPVGPPFLVGMGPFGRSGGSKFRRGTLISIPFLDLDPSLLVSKNLKAWTYEKSYNSRSGSTNNACCLRHGFSKLCLLYKEKCTSQICIFLPKFWALSFLQCVFYHLRHFRWKNNGPEDSKLRFFEPLGPFWSSGGPKFRCGMCNETAGFSTSHTDAHDRLMTPKPRVAMRSMAKRSPAHRTMLWECRKTHMIWRKWCCGAWTGVIESVMCVGVPCIKTCCFTLKFTTGVIFHERRPEITCFFLLNSSPLYSYGKSSENKIWIPKTHGKMGARNFGAPKVADHPISYLN